MADPQQTRTAGVSLIVRCSPMPAYAPQVALVITIVGAITRFSAATTGAFQNDPKRVTAYPTRSQSGYMVLARGPSSYPVTMSHLMNHASPKASSSLSAGPIIHASNDEQDTRRTGASNRIMPYTYAMTLIASSSATGPPFSTGYHSKDFILELACRASEPLSDGVNVPAKAAH